MLLPTKVVPVNRNTGHSAGAPTAADAWGQQMVVKVKEPQPAEIARLKDQFGGRVTMLCMGPPQAEDALRSWHGSTQALADICSLHHQRQLSTQLSCQFEGSVVQLEAGQPDSPKGRCKIDIVQYANASIEVLYRNQVLAHRQYLMHPHLAQKHSIDSKGVNEAVDKALRKQQLRLSKLTAQIDHQNAQRAKGIYTHDSHPSPPIARAGTARYGLRPSQSVPAQTSA